MDSDDEESENEVAFDVSVLDLLNFGGPNMMRRGDEVYRSNHLLDVGVSSVGKSICKILAFCLQSSHPTETPHSITITTGQTFDLWTFYCSCKGGSGAKCKHIYATLLHIHTSRTLKIYTCTELAQKWGKIAKERGEKVLEPVRIRDLSEFKKFVENTPVYHSFNQVTFLTM